MNCFKSFASKIFKYGGHIPKSVAIIMDGNRRYAQKKNIVKIQGHEDGLNKLLEIVEWSILLEIKEVTAFAFSIDNFNRSKEEFDNLMDLAKKKFAKLAEKGEYFDKKNIRVCIYGDLNLLEDKELIRKFSEMEKNTLNNNKIKLNICFSYNSTEESLRSLSFLQEKIKENENYLSQKDPKSNISNQLSDNKSENQIDSSISNDENKKFFENNLYGGYDCKPEILIRTSGEIRLSNFLLYQTRFSMLFFIEKYWPELNFYDYFLILLRYNYNYKSHRKLISEIERNNGVEIF